MKKNIQGDPEFYWEVGGKKTFSKAESLFLAKGDYSKISFYQQNHIWDNIDLSKEPIKNFDELCEENCRILRDRFDYLCLWLSSGYDSQTALQSFQRSGVPLDEIAFMDRSEYYQDPELFFIEKTVANYKKYYNSKVKINRIKIGFEYHKNLHQKHMQDIWYTGLGDNIKFSKSTASYIHNFHEDVLRLKSKKNWKRADIYGKEKPRLDLRNDQWYLQANDISYCDTIGAAVVCFYCNKYLPQLHIKQIYMQIRYFESLENLSHDLIHKIQSNDPSYYESWCLSIGRKPIECLESKNGNIKNNFKNDFFSRDSDNLLNYFSKSNDIDIKKIHEQKKEFDKDIKDIKIFTKKFVGGKDWLIRKRIL